MKGAPLSPWSAEFALWDIWIISWVLAAAWSARAAGRAGWRAQAPSLAVTALGFVFLFSQKPASPLVIVRLWRTPEPMGWAMVGCAALGFAFCWWARLHLGPLWSGMVTRKAEHRVVDSGPYRWVRHPIYTGILAAALSVAILDGTGGAFAGAALITLGLAMKARLEEGFLKRELGAASYEAYAARTPMLVPWPRRTA
jgi:protein-S-isoprenylcysteine O-methyltransferase Ste14